MRTGADPSALIEFDDETKLIDTRPVASHPTSPRPTTSHPASPPSTIPPGEAVPAPERRILRDRSNDAGHGPLHERLRKRCVDLVAELTDAPRRVLELGGGVGCLAEPICRQMEVGEYVLLDASPHMLELVRDRLRDFTGMRALLAPYGNPLRSQRVSGPFDAVLAIQSTHELRPKREHLALYQRIRSLLLPGGIFLVADLSPVSDSSFSSKLYATCEETCDWLHSVGFINVTLELADVYTRVGGQSSTLFLLSASRA